MWVILKFIKNDLNLLKKDLASKVEDENSIKFYLPKLKLQKFKKNKLHSSEILLLGDYLLCYHPSFQKSSIVNSLRYCRGLKYFLTGFMNNQKEINDFVKKCIKYEDGEGYIKQSFFNFDYSNYNKYKFLSGPFTSMIFKIISQQKNKIKILLGNFKTTVSEKEYLFRPV